MNLHINLVSFVLCMALIAAMGYASGRSVRRRNADATSAIPSVPEVDPAIVAPLLPQVLQPSAARHLFMIEQLSLHSRLIAEQLRVLNDVTDTTMTLAHGIADSSGNFPKDPQLADLLQHVRLAATEMLAIVQSLRGNTASMQRQLSQISAAVEHAVKITTITSDTGPVSG